MNTIPHNLSSRGQRLPPILARDYRRFVLYPRIAWAATYGALAVICAIVLLVRG